MREHYFETTAGVKIRIQPISLFDLQLAQDAVAKEFREAGKPIDPPQYEVDVLGGEKEYHPHTEKTIQDATEEEKEQWAAYQQAITELQEATQQRTALVFLDGILVDLPEGDAWVRRRKKIFGDDVPDDPDERLLYYVNNVLLKTPADKNGLMLEIQKLSMTGASEEAISAMEELFLSEVAILQRQGVEALKALGREEKDVVLQPSSKGRIGRKIEKYDTKSVQGITDRGAGRNYRRRKNTIKNG